MRSDLCLCCQTPQSKPGSTSSPAIIPYMMGVHVWEDCYSNTNLQIGTHSMTKKLLLGCIADDFTGASDLANTLAREGMRTTQYIEVPDAEATCDCEAAIIALKSRAIEPALAVEQSLAALRWLQRQGARQFLFKYCSTFDSTPAGNIGPVAEALLTRLDTSAVVVCPAFPNTGRTVYQGHLFVFDKLLNESGLENHPLNPMTDADLRRWLAHQTTGTIGHIAQKTVSSGVNAIRESLTKAAEDHHSLVVVDATADDDLRAIGAACDQAKLITGGSGIALGLPDNFRKLGLIGDSTSDFQQRDGYAAILAGSCSDATRRQIEQYRRGHKTALPVESIIDGSLTPEKLLQEIDVTSDPLVYSSASPDEVKKLQSKQGREKVAHCIEEFFGKLAVALVNNGVERLVVAGGETSGAVISALNLKAFDIGPEIDPGVPALSTRGLRPLAVALKSGNFGGEFFFSDAIDALSTPDAKRLSRRV